MTEKTDPLAFRRQDDATWKLYGNQRLGKPHADPETSKRHRRRRDDRSPCTGARP